MVNDHPPDIEVWTLRPSDFRFHPLLCELCVLCALCAKSFFVFELSTVNLFILPRQIGFPPPHPINRLSVRSASANAPGKMRHLMTKSTDANDRMDRPLDAVDPQIADLLRDEAKRQATGLELIPSENLVSEAVLEAMGSIFTNKYAEGYPGKRYYGGCEYADKVEQLAIDRAKELFGAEHANVQAHSGTSANVASICQPCRRTM